MSLQEHEEQNEEEELVFLDAFHRLTFVFYGEMIFLISSLQIPCEVHTERMPKALTDGGMEMDGGKDPCRNTTSPLFSCFSIILKWRVNIVPKCWGDFAVEQQGVGSDRFPQRCSYSDAKSE